MPHFTLPIFQVFVKAVARAMSKYGLFGRGWKL